MSAIDKLSRDADDISALYKDDIERDDELDDSEKEHLAVLN